MRDPRRPARYEGRRGREKRHARRPLPQYRMHALEGAAACFRNVRGGRAFLAKMGVSVSAPKLDLPAMMNFKQQGIDGNVKGVEFLMKKNKIDVISGTGR